MDLGTLLGPIGIETFLRDYFGRQPLHIPVTAARATPLIDWQRLSALLGVASHWTEGRLTLILNHRPILGDFFMDAAPDGSRRANPAKVEQFLAMGASLVGNDVELIAPELRAVTQSLGAQFAALTNANVYASFNGVQGFATHYDLHDVFALQCAGEKVWRLYANRAENPVEPLATGGEAAQAAINAARGRLAGTVRMRPGDLLYLPRGVYHDALAEDGPSLHVTFSVAPHSGAVVLQLLAAAALHDPAVRAYLADGRRDTAALDAQLADLAALLAAIVVSPGFRDTVIDAERARPAHAHIVRLPAPPPLVSYVRTARGAELRQTPAGTMLVTASSSVPLGPAFAVATYALSRPAFSAQELAARFAHVPEVEAVIALLLRERLVERYEPQLM